jgi:O-antigen/teichoic acid export membrane protein
MSVASSIRILFSKENQSRGVERIKRAGLTGMSSMMAQGITIAAGFISVPLTIGYLGQQRYGIWLTINSLLQWLYVSNLGLSGNALVNKLSDANGKEDKNLAQELVSTAFWTLGGLSAIFLLLFAATLPFTNWQWVFNTNEVAPNELQWAAIAAFICFVMMFPTSMVEAIYASYQEGYIGNIWNIAGSICSLIALIIVSKMEGGLPLLVASLFGVRLLFSFFNAAYLFFIRHPWLKPSPKAVTKKSFNSLMDLGWKYLVGQLSGIGMFQSQPMIITQVVGPESVTVFGIAQRFLTLPLIVVQMFSIPFMATYGEAKARGDWDWIKKNLRQTLILATVGSIAMVVPLCLAAKWIILHWVRKEEVVPSDGLIAFFGIYTIVACIVTPASVMLYGVERVGGQAVFSFINALLNVILGIILTQYFGIMGMVIAMTSALLLVNPIAQFTQIRQVFKDIPKQIKEN